MVRDPNRLSIAVQKSGRLSDESIALLKRCGIRFAFSKDQLFCYGENLPIDLLLVRDDDIPQLLRDNVCDLGIVGQNVAQEYALSNALRNGSSAYTELRRLDFGYCRLAIAIPEALPFADLDDLNGRRIATTYPAITRRFLDENGLSAEIVSLSGSVEIAPSLGTADAIADIVSSGATLRANKLREVATVVQSSAVMLQSAKPMSAANREFLDRLLLRIDGALQVKESKYVMLHAPRNAVEAISRLIPGAETPSILPLAGHPDKVALHAVCTETVLWEHLESLKEAGASSILVLPVEKMLL
ncbi:MAG: ATP phosphoribosyltransferase [Bacteroidetes bacterium]|nr:ATP phosphoribosyltransferase [Bacteroidota bacterium]